MRSRPALSIPKQGISNTKPLCFSTRFSKVFNCIPAVLWSPLDGWFVQPEDSRMHLFQATFTHRFSRRPVFSILPGLVVVVGAPAHLTDLAPFHPLNGRHPLQ